MRDAVGGRTHGFLVQCRPTQHGVGMGTAAATAAGGGAHFSLLLTYPFFPYTPKEEKTQHIHKQQSVVNRFLAKMEGPCFSSRWSFVPFHMANSRGRAQWCLLS